MKKWGKCALFLTKKTTIAFKSLIWNKDQNGQNIIEVWVLSGVRVTEVIEVEVNSEWKVKLMFKIVSRSPVILLKLISVPGMWLFKSFLKVAMFEKLLPHQKNLRASQFNKLKINLSGILPYRHFLTLFFCKQANWLH